MKVFYLNDLIKNIKESGENPFSLHRTGITVGSFDGVHKGHQLILSTLVDHCKKNDLLAGVFTFSKPLSFYKHNYFYPGDICTLEQRIAIFKDLGIDFVIIADFTPEFSALSGTDFFSSISSFFNINYIVEGSDFRCGNKGLFEKSNIQSYCNENGIECSFVNPVTIVNNIGESVRISSSLIRDMISESDFNNVNAYMNRNFVLEIPDFVTTLNIDKLSFTQVLPKEGIYNCLNQNNELCRLEVYNTRLVLSNPAKSLLFI